MAHDDGPHRGGFPFVPVIAFALGGLVVAAAALGAHPVLTGARWSPTVAQATAPPPEQVASAPASSAPQPPGAPSAHHVDATWLLVVAVVVIAALAVLAVVYVLPRRRRRGSPERIDAAGLAVDVTTDPSAEVGLQHIRRGLGRALAVLAEHRDPSDAVTAAWLGLQESAEDAGFRRGSAETPTEFTTRILQQLHVDETALSTLRRCYLAVRFGGVPATDQDVEAVRAALRTLEQQWAVAPTERS